jgi:ketosteroid isomerase-like protein
MIEAKQQYSDLARKFYSLLGQKNLDEWIQLWHEDGKILIPYPPEGFASTIEGKNAIHEAFKGLLGNFETFESTITNVYSDTNSDAVCIEYTNHATIVGGTVYTNTNIAVFRFNDGLISEYHDYFDPRRFQVVVDALSKS